MLITDYHAKYYTFELAKRCFSNSIEKRSASLSEARLDLNAHQIGAALFAFRSLFSIWGFVRQVQIPQKVKRKLRQFLDCRVQKIVDEMIMKNSTYFYEDIKELKKQARQAANLPEKLAIQKKIKGIQKNRDEAWREYDVAAKEIEGQKDRLIEEVGLHIRSPNGLCILSSGGLCRRANG